MTLLYYWSTNPSMTINQINIETGVHQSSIVDWYNFFRDTTQQWYGLYYSSLPLCTTMYMHVTYLYRVQNHYQGDDVGGPGTIVEIDESLVLRRFLIS